jgi:hypothetical protein
VAEGGDTDGADYHTPRREEQPAGVGQERITHHQIAPARRYTRESSAGAKHSEKRLAPASRDSLSQ